MGSLLSVLASRYRCLSFVEVKVLIRLVISLWPPEAIRLTLLLVILWLSSMMGRCFVVVVTVPLPLL